jgi:hypothetical protein
MIFSYILRLRFISVVNRTGRFMACREYRSNLRGLMENRLKGDHSFYLSFAKDELHITEILFNFVSQSTFTTQKAIFR